jgi:flagellar hook assembly protein FlgD
MARDGQAKVAIFDVNGRLVKTVFDSVAKEGPNEASWNGLDSSGRLVSSGVYFIRMSTLGESHQGKLVFLTVGGGR